VSEDRRKLLQTTSLLARCETCGAELLRVRARDFRNAPTTSMRLLVQAARGHAHASDVFLWRHTEGEEPLRLLERFNGEQFRAQFAGEHVAMAAQMMVDEAKADPEKVSREWAETARVINEAFTKKFGPSG
jgi:hypothetical protein